MPQQQESNGGDQQVKRRRDQSKGSLTRSSAKCMVGYGKRAKKKSQMSLRSDTNANRSERFLRLNPIRTKPDQTPLRLVADRIEQSGTSTAQLSNCREPADLAKQIDQELRDKVSSLSDLVKNQIQQFGELKERMNLLEARLRGDRQDTESDAASGGSDNKTEGGFDLNSVPILKVPEKLGNYNYTKWANAIQSQLESLKLDIFLRFSPKENKERAISYDRLLNKSIVATITAQAAAKIDPQTVSHTNQLWSGLRKLFYTDLLDRIEPNIAYLARNEVKGLDEIELHVQRFRIAALELKAVDHEISENALVELFLKSLANELPQFHLMMRQKIRDLSLDYEGSLDHAIARSCYSG